jgi:hypothetical protein
VLRSAPCASSPHFVSTLARLRFVVAHFVDPVAATKLTTKIVIMIETKMDSARVFILIFVPILLDRQRSGQRFPPRNQGSAWSHDEDRLAPLPSSPCGLWRTRQGACLLTETLSRGFAPGKRIPPLWGEEVNRCLHPEGVPDHSQGRSPWTRCAPPGRARLEREETLDSTSRGSGSILFPVSIVSRGVAPGYGLRPLWGRFLKSVLPNTLDRRIPFHGAFVGDEFVPRR